MNVLRDRRHPMRLPANLIRLAAKFVRLTARVVLVVLLGARPMRILWAVEPQRRYSGLLAKVSASGLEREHEMVPREEHQLATLKGRAYCGVSADCDVLPQDAEKM